MDEKTTDTFVIYQSNESDTNDALYVNGVLVKQGARSAVLRDACERTGVEFRVGTQDHIHNGNYVRELSDIRQQKKIALKKRAQQLETEGAEIVAALHEIGDMYWGPYDDED